MPARVEDFNSCLNLLSDEQYRPSSGPTTLVFRVSCWSLLEALRCFG